MVPGRGLFHSGVQEFEDTSVTLLPTQSPVSHSKAMSPHSLVPAGPPTLFPSTSLVKVPKRTETSGSLSQERDNSGASHWKVSSSTRCKKGTRAL